MEDDKGPDLEAALSSPFFNASPDGIVVVDATGTIVAANPQIAEIFGYADDELKGEPVESLIPTPLRQDHHSHRDTYTADPRPRSMAAGLRLKALHKNGDEVPVDIALSPITAAGEIYTIASVRDATARLEAEIAISEFEEWRAISDDRQRIARDLHDTVIQDIFAAGMGLQALQRQMPDDRTTEQMGASISHLDSVITRLRGVIFNLTHGDESEPFEAAARRVVHESLNGSGLDLDFKVTATTPLPARTQEHILATLQEAISNAVRHASATKVDVVIAVDDSLVSLCVADDGVGMPDAAATRAGFGLTNMMNRAQVLGGSCDITPTPGGGTMVEWKVPL